MSSYIPDQSGINSLGGFAYQIKVFASFMLSMSKDMQTGFETIDDVSIGNLTSDTIDKNEDSFRSKAYSDDGISAIQVKRTSVNASVSEKILLNWIMLEDSDITINEYILYTDEDYKNRDSVFDISCDKLYEQVINTEKTARATIGKVKKRFENKKSEFEKIYNEIKRKYKFVSKKNIDLVIDEQCEVIFKKAGVSKIIYYSRIKELLNHITCEIISAVNDKDSYTISYEELMGYAEDISNRYTDTLVLPRYSDFKRTNNINFSDLKIASSREYNQLLACKLPDNIIEMHLQFGMYYQNLKYCYMELRRIGKIKDIEETSFENFENVKFSLQKSNCDTPFKRLEETKKLTNSYADSDQIKYGSSVYLTREEENINQISWEDEDNAESGA